MIGSKPFANYWYSSLFPAELQNENNYNALTHHMKQIQGGAVIIFFIISAFFALLYFRAMGSINQTTFIVLMLIVAAIDLVRISRPFLNQCTKSKNYFARQENVEHSIERYLKSMDPSNYRVYSMLGDDKFYVPGLEMTWIFDDFIDKKYFEVVQFLRMAAHALGQPEYATNQTVQSRFRNALSLLNTKYLVTFSELKVIGLQEIINSGGLRIYGNPYVLPRFYLADEIIPGADVKETVMKNIDSPLFRQNTVIIDKNQWKERTLDTSIDSLMTNNINIITYDTRKGYTVVDVVSNREQMLVISENNNPGWKVTLNNSPVEIFNVNYISKGILVPKGKSRVILEYNSPIAVKWRKITAITAVLFGLFTIVALFVEIRNLK
ncbi:MAG: YfhO family protein, partial [Ignavibacteria bacterium]|nr:YfhO family protein [Ignavibacteria bacterium]